MSVSTLFIGLDVASSVLICLVTLGTVVGLADFYFILSILCVLLLLSRLIRATVSVFFNTLSSCSTIIVICVLFSHMCEPNTWRRRSNAETYQRAARRVRIRRLFDARELHRREPASLPPWSAQLLYTLFPFYIHSQISQTPTITTKRPCWSDQGEENGWTHVVKKRKQHYASLFKQILATKQENK